MSPQAAQRQQAQQQGLTPTEQAALAALVVVILSGVSTAVAADYAVAILEPLGLPVAAIRAAVRLAIPDFSGPQGAAFGAVGARGWVEQTSAARSAAYIHRAAQRMGQDFDAIGRERRFLAQHREAERIRHEMADRVDAAAARWGPVLGWYARLDNVTTPECEAANGQNFRALPPPALGYPGTLHGGTCRCLPGPPHPRGELLP